jgi:hypothetical protein
MNAGIAVGLLAFAQLVLAWLTDKSLGDYDLPIITQQLSNFPTLGIKDFFAPHGTVDEKRISEVVGVTRLTNAARSALVALIIAFFGALTTAIIAYAAMPVPPLKVLRVAGAGIGAAVALIMFLSLGIQLLKQTLRTTSEKEPLFPNGPSPKGRLCRYLKRVRDRKVLTPYLTTAFFVNAITIIAAIKLD